MKIYPLLAFTVCIAVNSISAADEAELGVFHQWTDIGSPGVVGSAFYKASENAYYLKASGENIWGETDSFGFLWAPMEGDFSMDGIVTIIDLTDAPHRKAGWMIRSSLDPDAAHVTCAVHGDGLVAFQYRPTAGAATVGIRFDMKAAEEIRLTKQGNNFTMVVGKQGANSESKTLELDGFEGALFAGPWVCSKNVEKLEAARFGQVSILVP